MGDEDELGTLNLITPEVRRRAASLVVEGVSVSMGSDVDTVQRPLNPRPAWHVMHRDEGGLSYATGDSVHLDIHGVETHLDALGHVSLDGLGYNGRRQGEVVTNDGLLANSISAMRDGIVTRGLLLDVAAARGVPWLDGDHVVTRADLDAAERHAGLTTEPPGRGRRAHRARTPCRRARHGGDRRPRRARARGGPLAARP